MSRIAGKVVAVTGASSGIGKVTARVLGERGAKVVLGARRVAQLDEIAAELRGRGGQAIVCATDVTRRDDVERLVGTAVSEFGRLDVLVNNAGLIRRADARDFKDDDWDTVLEVDLSSVFCLSRDAGRHMLDRGSGKIINIASVLSFQGGIRVPAYAAAKGAVAQLTKALANEWAGRGVNVNAIAPGYIRTDNTRALQDDEARSRQIQDRIPAGRWGEPDDLGGAVVFLASQASDYVHGHVLVVDGGWMGR
jgi:2-deoxy-D-gluconate 3-dehydrogenase